MKSNNLSRVTPNPLVDRLEEKHGAMLDEIHRLIASAGKFNCVCMPHAIQFEDDGSKWRRSMDHECSKATISLDADLSFRLTGETVAGSAADAVERFGKELLDVATAIRENGKRIEGKPTTKRKAAKVA